MTLQEYEAFCLRQLDGHEWQKEHADLASSYREYYARGGWNEEDLKTLVTLHLLWEWLDSYASDYLAGRIEKEDDSLVACDYYWHHVLPVRDELREEVIRQCVVEHRLQVLENVDVANLNDQFRLVHKRSLAKARASVIAAALGVLPGSPEHDEWIERHTDVEGVTTD